MPATAELMALEKKHVNAASRVLARAFFRDPLTECWFPDPRSRMEVCRDILAVELNYSLLTGEVYTTSEALEGIAGWQPPGGREGSFWNILLSGLIPLFPRVGLRTMRRIRACELHAARLREKWAPFPHWYLTLLGVDPEYQGRGYASRLLRPMLDRMDEGGHPCYLETHSRDNLPIYRHFGFRPVGQTAVPYTGVRQFSLLREPRSPLRRPPE